MSSMLSLVRLRGVSALEALRVEEALLRAAEPSTSYLVITDGVRAPACVLGVSNKVEEALVGGEAALRGGAKAALLRRFTGGGSVVVDENSILCALVLSSRDFLRQSAMRRRAPSGHAAAVVVGAEREHTEDIDKNCDEMRFFPRPVMRWTESFYRRALELAGCQAHDVGTFRVRENDYVFGERKFGGNAQSFSSGRCCHHTSFLWDYDTHRMDLLSNPTKQPEYRKFRGHDAFVCRLKDYLPSRSRFIEAIVRSAVDEGFDVEPLEHARLESIMAKKHQQTTRELLGDSCG